VLAALNVPIGKHFTLSPRVGIAFPISDSDLIEALSFDGESVHPFGGLRISAAF